MSEQENSRKTKAAERLTRLREQMKQYGIDIYLIVTDDFHASEYVGEYFKCRKYISGFTGSAGTLVVTAQEAGLWTDGRYFIQAEQQLSGSGITLYRMGEPKVPTIAEYLAKTVKAGGCIGYDGRTLRYSYASALKKSLKGKKVRFEEKLDLVGMIWEERPKLPAEPVWLLSEEYAGRSRKEKLQELRGEMKKERADVFLLSALDDIAWLYNLRGADIAYNPVALAYTLVKKEEAYLYINPGAVSEEIRLQLLEDGVRVCPYFDVYCEAALLKKGTAVMLDEDAVNVALRTAIPAGVRVINKPNPTRAAKAVKNPTEMAHAEEAHQKDGVAVTKLIYWLKREYGSGKLTELSVCDKLEEFRQQQEHYRGQSFAPIAASGAHGAIVHYDPLESEDNALVENDLLLLDTGGQYLEGTTDITRTIALGEADARRKECYTAVLRGNLNLAAAVFKYGVTGTNLDAVARMPLWEKGLDYNHGTGHGVGYLLNVHEGPNAFRLKEAGGRIGAVLEEGMITSDEPGYYEAGQFGIRLENLLLCKKGENTKYGQFMEFETLTLVPFDRSMILPEQMSDRELALLNEYHARVYETLSAKLTEEERSWLAEETAPITGK